MCRNVQFLASETIEKLTLHISSIPLSVGPAQGYNARKVISEVCASFVLQCTVSGQLCKHQTDVEAWHGIHLLHKKKSIKYSGHRKLLCELSKLSKFNAFKHLGY